MVDMLGLFVHTATVRAKTTVNLSGRIYTEWLDIGSIRCRFTQPTPRSVNVTAGVDQTQIDAVVYASPEYAELIKGCELPIRLVVTGDVIWTGVYEMSQPCRTYNAADAMAHHVEFNVVRLLEV